MKMHKACVAVCLLLVNLFALAGYKYDDIIRVNFTEVAHPENMDINIGYHYYNAIRVAEAKHQLTFVNDSELTPLAIQHIRDYANVMRKKGNMLPFFETGEGYTSTPRFYVRAGGIIEMWDISKEVAKVTPLPKDDYHAILIRNFPELLSAISGEFSTARPKYEKAIEIARIKNELILDDTGGISQEVKDRIFAYSEVLYKKSPLFLYQAYGWNSYPYSYGEIYYVLQKDGGVEAWSTGTTVTILHPKPNDHDLVLFYNFPEIANEPENGREQKRSYMYALEVLEAKGELPSDGKLSDLQKAKVREYHAILNDSSDREFVSFPHLDTAGSSIYVRTGNGDKLEVWICSQPMRVRIPGRDDHIAVMYESFPEVFRATIKEPSQEVYFYAQAIKLAAKKKALTFEKDNILDGESKKRVQAIYDKIFDPQQMVFDIMNALGRLKVKGIGE